MHLPQRWTDLIAQGDSGGELFYIIAVLILSAVGGLAEKFKKSKEKDREELERQRKRTGPKPTPPRKVQRPPTPPKPRPQPAEPSLPPAAEAEEAPSPWMIFRPPEPEPEPAPRPPRPPKGPKGKQKQERKRLSPTAKKARRDTEAAVAETTNVLDQIKSQHRQRRGTVGARARELGIPKAGKMTHHDLRRAILMNEILQPCLALRDED